MPISIMFCYAREDEPLLNKLKAHLSPLVRQGLINTWYDRNILAGDSWEQHIQHHLNTSQIILLLLSPDFMASDYCYSTEMKRALERHRRGKARVIPIIVRPVFWHTGPLGKLQALPTDGRPVTDPYWHDIDDAFYDIVQELYLVIENMPAPPSTPTSSRVPPFLLKSPAASVSPLLLAANKLRVIRTLTGHTRMVDSVAFGSDGNILASGDFDSFSFSNESHGTIMLWNPLTGELLNTLHTSGIHCMAFSPDGSILASGGQDKQIRLWNSFSRQEVGTLNDHTSTVWSVTFSPDGRTLVSGSNDQTIKVWDLLTNRHTFTLSPYAGRSVKPFEGNIQSVVVSPDGQYLIGATNGGSISLWTLSTGEAISTFTDEGTTICCLALAADGRTLVSTSHRSPIKVWDLSTGLAYVRTHPDYKGYVRSLVLSPDGHTLVSAGSDNTIKIWGT